MRKNFNVLILLLHWVRVLWVLHKHHELVVAHLADFAGFGSRRVRLCSGRAESAGRCMLCPSICREAALLRACAPGECISRILRLEFPLFVHALFTDPLPTELTMLRFSCTGKILFAKIALPWCRRCRNHRSRQLEYSICYVKISGLITNFDFVFLLSEVTRQHEVIFLKYLWQNSLWKRHPWRRSLLRSTRKLSFVPSFVSLLIPCHIINSSRWELPLTSIRIETLILLQIVRRLYIIVRSCLHELFIRSRRTILWIKIRLLLHFIYNPDLNYIKTIISNYNHIKILMNSHFEANQQEILSKQQALQEL